MKRGWVREGGLERVGWRAGNAGVSRGGGRCEGSARRVKPARKLPRTHLLLLAGGGQRGLLLLPLRRRLRRRLCRRQGGLLLTHAHVQRVNLLRGGRRGGQTRLEAFHKPAQLTLLLCKAGLEQRGPWRSLHHPSRTPNSSPRPSTSLTHSPSPSPARCGPPNKPLWPSAAPAAPPPRGARRPWRPWRPAAQANTREGRREGGGRAQGDEG